MDYTFILALSREPVEKEKKNKKIKNQFSF